MFAPSGSAGDEADAIWRVDTTPDGGPDLARASPRPDHARFATFRLALFDASNFPDADPRWRKFLTLKDQARFRPNIPAGQALWTELATVVPDAIHGRGTPRALLDGVTERVNAELAKYGG